MDVLIVGLIAVGLWVVFMAFVIRKSKTDESQRILRGIRAKGGYDNTWVEEEDTFNPCHPSGIND